MTGSPALTFERVVAGYGDAPVLTGLDLTVDGGERVAVLGPSGSGKTTLLSVAAGFLPVREGRVVVGGEAVDIGDGRPVPPERRGVGVVFQSHALWPHLTALETVAYPLRRAGMRRDESHRRAGALLERLDLTALAGRRPAEMSGGQQQRVGIARAIARRPSLFLLDEPAANLDGPLRQVVRDLVVEAAADTGAAVILATHDAPEALGVADRLVLLRRGAIVQSGDPVGVYERPVDVWAARLTGPADLISVTADSDGAVLIGGVEARPRGVPDAGEHRVLVRPEWAELGGPLPGEVRSVEYRGSHTDVRMTTPAGDLHIRRPGPPTVRPGDHPGWELRRVWALPG